jgi:hypothetical protein
VLAAVELLKRLRRRARSLARQLTAAVAVSIGLSTIGVAGIALLMFISPHDALVMAVLLLFAGSLGAYSVWALAGGTLADIRAVRDGLREVGRGRRDVEVGTGARDELARAPSTPSTAAATGRRGRARAAASD